ncbi:MAG: 1-phosphofructokinase [Propionicimonas sp.]|uniref:1-phosphofructokinase n=1 Tax=Propionicimonas sp. TaxID=1955623 RepID=UPI002B1EB7FB|nr:1-phosphofructokinase [Propionicimonas sp.]MEA4945366.1 1-phosphofructokinase [Propionicimonas sp.]
MIVTLTPNPSVDRTVSISSLERGSVMRAFQTREDPGGKGLNVSRALALHGTATAAVLPIGGVYGRLMLDLLEPLDVQVEPVRIRQAIRANIAIVEPDGTTTKINELGPQLRDDELDALRDAVRRASGTATWVVCCGSLPPGVADGFYADMVRSCQADGLKVAVDSSGGPLVAALAAGPDLIKPNRVELAEAVGRDLPTVGAVVDAARTLIAAGIGTVVISLGRDGALLVDASEVIQATARVSQPLSTVGAGDALLAGYLHAVSSGSDAATALRTAVAFGAAAVALPGSEMPNPDQMAKVDVQVTVDPDPARLLDD